MKLKKGDEVKIIKGKDKGKTGKIEKVVTETFKVLVTGVNQYKRHVKGNSMGRQSEIITVTKPMPVSNVSFLCPKCKKISRIGSVYQGKEKMRICRKCKKTL